MLVELVGHPGSGKTDLAQGIEELLQSAGTFATRRVLVSEPGAATSSRGRRVWVRAVALVSSPRLALVGAALALSVRDGRAVSLTFATAKKTKRLRAMRSEPRTWLIDEGPIHHACAVVTHADPDRPERWMRLVRRAPSPDVVVRVRCDPALVQDRLRVDRPRHSLVRMETDAAIDWVHRYDALADSHLRSTGVPVVDVDSTGVDSNTLAKDAIVALGRLGVGSAGTPGESRPSTGPRGHYMATSVDRVRSRYRREGATGVLRAARARLIGASPDGRAYQEKVAGSMADRQRMIRSVLPEGSTTAIDIGCNLGDMTQFLARSGFWAVGIDCDGPLVEAAQRRATGVRDCAFMQMDVGPDDIARLPRVDVILLLSVHHNWMHAHGPATTGAMVRGLVERTDGVLVVEVAARRSRYGDHPPDFVDNDEASVTAYHEAFFASCAGDVCADIKLLGKATCVGEREPFRWTYALRPKGR